MAGEVAGKSVCANELVDFLAQQLQKSLICRVSQVNLVAQESLEKSVQHSVVEQAHIERLESEFPALPKFKHIPREMLIGTGGKGAQVRGGSSEISRLQLFGDIGAQSSAISITHSRRDSRTKAAEILVLAQSTQ